MRKPKTIEVSIAMKISVDVPAYRLGKQTPRAYAEKLARKMLAQAGEPVRKISGAYGVSTDWNTAEHSDTKIYSDKDIVVAPNLALTKP